MTLEKTVICMLVTFPTRAQAESVSSLTPNQPKDSVTPKAWASQIINFLYERRPEKGLKTYFLLFVGKWLQKLIQWRHSPGTRSSSCSLCPWGLTHKKPQENWRWYRAMRRQGLQLWSHRPGFISVPPTEYETLGKMLNLHLAQFPHQYVRDKSLPHRVVRNYGAMRIKHVARDPESLNTQ